MSANTQSDCKMQDEFESHNLSVAFSLLVNFNDTSVPMYFIKVPWISRRYELVHWSTNQRVNIAFNSKSRYCSMRKKKLKLEGM